MLPDDRPETLSLFAKYAHSHVTDTRVEYAVEGSNVRATYRFVCTLSELGHIDAATTSLRPFANVFIKSGKKTYITYNFGAEPIVVTFSDGTKLTVQPHELRSSK